MSGRSLAQTAALERDGWRCQWCLRVLGRIRPATDAHHVFRPRSLYDQSEYVIGLCHECHLGLRHTSGLLTDSDLVKLVLIPYIWNGKDLTPHGF